MKVWIFGSVVLILLCVGILWWKMEQQPPVITYDVGSTSSPALVVSAAVATTTTIPSTPSTPTIKSTPPVISTKPVYTRATVAAHASAKNCWTIINGKVYDLTSFIPHHPGGEVIVSICGKDGTAAFQDQHDGQGRPEAMLATLLLGPLQ